ncbi:MAG: hypothetical protein ACRDJL_11870 [Actinomycetota bacterium]
MAQIRAAILPYFPVMAAKFLSKLSQDPDELRAENLRAWVASLEGTISIAEVEPRCGCRTAGVVQNIRIDPREGTGSIEATIIDGTGRMIAKWLGRSSLQGVRLGVGLIIQGIPGVSRDGVPVVLNPEYTLVPGPEHG